jgi:hypothetical protein
LHVLRTPETEEMAKGVLTVLRTDKLIVATPIKAGDPDAEHPGKGISGKYSYDWQVVDRTFDYYKRLNIMPYISIDATPQILGGKVPPFSGEKLKTTKSASSGFPPTVPNDMDAFGEIVRDLVHHVIVEQKYVVPYWGVWNEPDGLSFWNNNLDDYLRLYKVCVKAVKAVDPKLKVGGPETAHFNEQWTEGLIKYCAEQKLPLDFVSWHYYLGTVHEMARVRPFVDRWAKQNGMPPLELICGEWCWQIHNFPKTGYKPWRDCNYYLNDWHAAFTAGTLMEFQRAGVVIGIYTNPVAEDGAAGFSATGLMSKTHPWANLNVFRLWSKLAPQILPSSYDGHPGVFAQASRDDSGKITVLVTHLRYRKDFSPKIDVKINGAGIMSKDFKITQYVIDDQHSNRYDAGEAHTELETMPPPEISGSAETLSLSLTMRPRSVHLIVLEPIKK